MDDSTSDQDNCASAAMVTPVSHGLKVGGASMVFDRGSFGLSNDHAAYRDFRAILEQCVTATSRLGGVIALVSVISLFVYILA